MIKELIKKILNRYDGEELVTQNVEMPDYSDEEEETKEEE